MKTVERLTPVFVVVLLTMGFTLHLANLGQYAHQHQTRLASIISPVMDGMLGLWMAFCAALPSTSSPSEAIRSRGVLAMRVLSPVSARG